jgi:diguanylate cyclase (GGDEF)-like protein
MIKLNVLLSAFMFASSILTLFLALISLRWKTSYTKTLAFICFAVSLYSFGYGMELFNTDLKAMIFWNMVQHLGALFIPTLWLILALQYTAQTTLLKSLAFRLGIFIIPALTLIICFTNSFHQLYYTDQTYLYNSFFPVLHLEKGPWYIVQFIFLSICVMSASILYLAQYKKTAGPVRHVCLVMFFASFLPWLTAIMNLLNVSPYYFNWVPFAATISSILFLLALFQWHLLELKPLAKEKVFECTSDAIIILNNAFKIIDFNPSASKVLPSLTSDSLGKHIEKIFKEKTSITRSIFNGKKIVFNTVLDNCRCFFSISTSSIQTDKHKVIGWIITITDITRYVEMMNKLNRLATKDDLTGINNRRYFIERSTTELERLNRSKGSLSLIMLDLDFFKEINDRYGHQAGDVVLQAVAKVCQKNVRSFDILGRFGGEEFTILLPDTFLHDALKIAERLRGKIEALTVHYDNHKLKVTASMGITGIASVNEEDLNYLIKEADLALYLAKQEGRNCIRIKYNQDRHTPNPFP